MLTVEIVADLFCFYFADYLIDKNDKAKLLIGTLFHKYPNNSFLHELNNHYQQKNMLNSPIKSFTS
jgi:hypothetical protein